MLYVCILQSFLVYLFNFYDAISELEQNKQNNTIIFFTIYFFNKKVDLSSLRGGAGAPIAPPLPTGLEHWLHHEGPWYPLKEVWDGSRFSEVSWFWDLDCEWFLPIRCCFCSSVLSAEEIERSPYDGHTYTVTCCQCGSVNTCKGEKAKGDPRNSTDGSLGWVVPISQ